MLEKVSALISKFWFSKFAQLPATIYNRILAAIFINRVWKDRLLLPLYTHAPNKTLYRTNHLCALEHSTSTIRTSNPHCLRHNNGIPLFYKLWAINLRKKNIRLGYPCITCKFWVVIYNWGLIEPVHYYTQSKITSLLW